MSGNGWALAVAGLGSCLIIAAACAGGDTPPRTDDLEYRICTTYESDCPMGAAGSVSMGTGGSGTGGSSAGTGGSASGTGGSASGTGGSASGSAGTTAGSGSSGSGSTGEVCDAPTVVLRFSCGLGSGCHGDGAALGDFGASAEQALALVDRTTKNGCGKYIDSANPDQSMILLKASGTQAAGCGGDMPPNTNGLSDDDIACIKSWVEAQ